MPKYRHAGSNKVVLSEQQGLRRAGVASANTREPVFFLGQPAVSRRCRRSAIETKADRHARAWDRLFRPRAACSHLQQRGPVKRAQAPSVRPVCRKESDSPECPRHTSISVRQPRSITRRHTMAAQFARPRPRRGLASPRILAARAVEGRPEIDAPCHWLLKKIPVSHQCNIFSSNYDGESS